MFKTSAFIVSVSLASSVTAFAQFRPDMSKEFPNATIGAVMYTDINTGRITKCTGTLVGEDLVLTTTSCVFEVNGDFRKNLRFFANLNGQPQNHRDFSRIVHARFGTKVIKTGDDVPNTWVLARIATPLGKRYGFMGTEDVALGTNYLFSGYGANDVYKDPQDRDLRIEITCNATKVLQSGLAISNCPSGKGLQGAPLWSKRGVLQGVGAGTFADQPNQMVFVRPTQFASFLSEMRTNGRGAIQSTVHLCNNNTSSIWVAVAGLSENPTGAKGWFAIEASACLEFNVTPNASGHIYLYATTPNGPLGGSNQDPAFCINPRKVFNFPDANLANCSGENQVVRMMPYKIQPRSINQFTYIPPIRL